MKSLVVDDELASRSKLQKVMETFGPCDAVENGDEAVLAFIKALRDDDPYHVILMDIMMPVMDGQEALQRIRKVEKERGVAPGKEVRVIVISSLDDQKNVCDAFFRGLATHYLTKPVSREALIETLESIRL